MKKEGSLSFEKFFPIFRDSILGLSYIHNKYIAHRDIKPANILKINENSYKLSDYGEGINLNFNYKYLNKVDFSTGNFTIQGTLSYLDPLLYISYKKS